MTEHAEYRASLCERRNSRSGATEWVLWWKHPANTGDKPIWLDVPAGNSWFTSRTDHEVFCAAIERRLTVAVGFKQLADGYGFLEKLRPAEIGNDEPARGMAHTP